VGRNQLTNHGINRKFEQEYRDETLRKTNNVLAMGRQIKTLATKVGEVHDIKVKIQELKIEKGENIEDIQTWKAALEDKLFAIEAQIADLDNSLKRIGQKAIEAEKEEEMAAQSRQRKFEDELKLEKAKLEQRMRYSTKYNQVT
jgi:hypothetical protein